MAPKLTDDTRISFKPENPKKAGSKAHERYQQYKTASTVAEAIRLKATRADLTNDVKQGFCTILDADSQPRADADVVAAPAAGSIAAAAVAAGSSEGRPDEDAKVSEPPAKRRLIDAAATEAVPAAASVPDAPQTNADKPAAPVHAEAAGSVAAPKESLPAPVEAETVAHPAVPAPVEPPQAPTESTSSSSSSAAASASQVDLSFAKLEGKPLKYVKRTMGEAKRILSEQGLSEAKTSGCKLILKDRDNLSRWMVELRDLNPEGKLIADLKKHGLEPCIDLELILPDGFPLEPPFARVLYPELRGGYVFGSGGICFEPLTKKGWVPSMTLPALAIAIKGILDYGEVRVSGVGDKAARTVKHYTEAGARKDHTHISNAHRGGEGSTYGSLRNYAS